MKAAVRAVVRHGLFPVLAFGPGALALWLAWPSPTYATYAGCATIIVATYALLAWLERVAPHRASWNHDKGDVRPDVAYFLFVGPASAAVAAVAATLLVDTLHGGMPGTSALAVWPTTWPLAAQLFTAVLVAEFGHYVFHRLGHEVPFVWRFHAIHHSAERLYWLNATRFHPLDLLVLAFLQVFPLHLLGIPVPVYVAYVVASSCYGQLQHANVEVDTRAYAWLFATPELHRWHHSTRPAEGNANYGAILIFWDQLFRTRFWPGRPIEAEVGIGDLPGFPRRFVAQLKAPFAWRSIVEARREDGRPLGVTHP